MFSGKTKPRYVVVQVGEYYFVKDMKGTVLGSLYAELSYQGVAKGWWTTQNRDKYCRETDIDKCKSVVDYLNSEEKVIYP